VFDAFVIAVAAAALLLAGTMRPPALAAPPGPPAPPAPPGPPSAPIRIRGAYNVTFAGDVRGTGLAVVSAKDVKINATLKAASGGAAVFSATFPLDPSGYRFKGDGTLDGKSANVSGRMDPDDGAAVPRSCRLCATFTSSTGALGRLVGTHR
jgi:hypothetical protein